MRYGAGLVLLLVCPGVFASPSAPRTLSFEQRVKAQAAIERVYFTHQIGVTKPFEEAVPSAVLESKVRTYLSQSAALSTVWMTPVTDEMLQRELERMAQGTRLPDRLLELYAALGNDSFLVKECLARPALVDRLTRNFYGFDPAMHDTARKQAEALQAQLASGALRPSSDNPNRLVVELMADATAPDADPVDAGEPVSLRLKPAEFQQRRAELPALPGQVSDVRETRDAFTVSVVLSETTTSARVARYLVPKTSWEAWWSAASVALNADTVLTVASDQGALPSPKVTASTADLNPATGSACSGDDSWDNGALAANTKPATYRAAVWTGSLMVVWGGFDGSAAAFTNGGARYDPATDTWAPTSTTGAPSVRSRATAVWTGSRMVVWGGYLYENTGGRYDPVSDTWLPTSMVGVPSPRYRHTAVWTGSAMIVWGGSDSGGNALATGGRYDPATDSWTPTSLTNAPSGRFEHTAVWSGNAMLVWGGVAGPRTNNGGRYDPATDSWKTMSTISAPSARSEHSAVWSGTALLVWGGYNGSGYLNTGGRYNVLTDTWAPIATSGAPTQRSRHSAVWTGNRMIVWAGYTSSFPFSNTGGRYDPSTDTWTTTSTVGAPSARYDHNAVWTGALMLVVGGQNNGALPNTGGRYNPSDDTWTPTAPFGDPPRLYEQTGVWTGSLMVVWGGNDGFTPYLDTGARYDPATDLWTPTSRTGAPSARQYHTAVWTGSVMIVWGGNPENTIGGGRYDPLTDSWLPTSTTGAPFGRTEHSAVWTGTSMIIWGGASIVSGNSTTTGGRYDPTTDTWMPTSTIGAPVARILHTAVWTGGQMIVWAGATGVNVQTRVNTGGRYNPSTDSWAPTSIVNAPSARTSHSVAWTGSRMIVWGGGSNAGSENTGGLYDPVGDTWMPTSVSGAPVARRQHSAVWTGNVMVNWGGYSAEGDKLITGGRYDPATNNWNPTSTTGAPVLSDRTCVWTGTMMIVWGGDQGGRYIVGTGCDDGNPCTDDSCDLATGCVHTNNTSDCNDGNVCTTNDSCSGGLCVGGAAPNCDDGNACTSDACNPGTGCVHNTASCVDGNLCTDDSCNPTTGCVYTNNTVACNDGSACTFDDACSGGACVGGAVTNCDDGNVCTTDSCDPAVGCVVANNANACDDGNACTRTDVCSAGACVGGSPVVCAGPDACHDVGICDPISGNCSNPVKPDGTVCDDQSLCTTGETCQSGTCVPALSGLNHPAPKSAGYYKKLCQQRDHIESHYQGDELTDADAMCVGQLTSTFAGMATVNEFCEVIDSDHRPPHGGRHHGGPGDGANGKDCDKGEDELIATALNICRARVCEEQNLDSRCHGNSHTTVSQSFADADAILDDAARTKDTCKDARCELREINNGHALEMNSLLLSTEGQNVRLSWLAMALDDGSGVPRRYEVWRRPMNSVAEFVKIGETRTDLTFLDTTVGTDLWEYDVTADIP